MLPRLRTLAGLTRLAGRIRLGGDRGAETVDKALWMAVIIVVVGAVGLLFRDAITQFFNSLVFDIGFGADDGADP